MGKLEEELGVDAIGPVSLAQQGWHQKALSMIDDRRRQVIAAEKRATTELQHEAVVIELTRMADLEFYVRRCEELFDRERSYGTPRRGQLEVKINSCN
jgi:hypothetical protein